MSEYTVTELRRKLAEALRARRAAERDAIESNRRACDLQRAMESAGRRNRENHARENDYLTPTERTDWEACLESAYAKPER
jgi:hypothetical protein